MEPKDTSRNASLKRAGSTADAVTALEELRFVPRAAWDVGLPTVAESQADIAEEVARAMADQRLSVYELHERTGLPRETIEAVLVATLDLSDSEPITILQNTLGVSLHHL